MSGVRIMPPTQESSEASGMARLQKAPSSKLLSLPLVLFVASGGSKNSIKPLIGSSELLLFLLLLLRLSSAAPGVGGRLRLLGRLFSPVRRFLRPVSSCGCSAAVVAVWRGTRP